MKRKKHNIEPIYPLLKQRIILNAGSIRLFYSSNKLCYVSHLHTLSERLGIISYT